MRLMIGSKLSIIGINRSVAEEGIVAIQIHMITLLFDIGNFQQRKCNIWISAD